MCVRMLLVPGNSTINVKIKIGKRISIVNNMKNSKNVRGAFFGSGAARSEPVVAYKRLVKVGVINLIDLDGDFA